MTETNCCIIDPYPGWPISNPWWEQTTAPTQTIGSITFGPYHPDLEEIKKDIEDIKQALRAKKIYKKPTKKELRIKELAKELKELLDED